MSRNFKSPVVLVVLLLALIAGLAYFVMNNEGFRGTDCVGVTCEEGQFCQQNTCHPIYPPETNEY
jgi:hypothetical protein